MTLAPDFETFKRRYDAGAPQVVLRRRVCDLETPISAYLKLTEGRRNSFLLESVQGGEVWARYTIMGFKPDLIWRAHGANAEINRRALSDLDAFIPEAQPTLESFRALLAESRIELPEDLPPMAAGVFGYFGYDTVRLMERLPDANPDELNMPDAVFVRPTVIAIFDLIAQELVMVSPVRPEPSVSAEAAYARAEERLADADATLDRGVNPPEAPFSEFDPSADLTSNTTKPEYEAMVEKAKSYIEAGDIFQVVLSQRFSAPFPQSPFSLYRALRRTNPSPFLFFLDFDDGAVVGSSPEILVRVRGEDVTVRPIAGTRKRGATPEEDLALEKELLADPKECAEHLMLLDLGRNDVGRVSRTGEVQVDEQFIIERYSHVMHIVSNVIGRLAPEHDVIDALVAGFPAGTVSGAPKIRAMEIIDELEKHKRGVYGGAVGYFAAGGDMDSCIALRTAVVKEGRLYVQAGAGIVADSQPDREYQETVDKAQAIISAAATASRTPGRNR